MYVWYCCCTGAIMQRGSWVLRIPELSPETQLQEQLPNKSKHRRGRQFCCTYEPGWLSWPFTCNITAAVYISMLRIIYIWYRRIYRQQQQWTRLKCTAAATAGSRGQEQECTAVLLWVGTFTFLLYTKSAYVSLYWVRVRTAVHVSSFPRDFSVVIIVLTPAAAVVLARAKQGRGGGLAHAVGTHARTAPPSRWSLIPKHVVPLYPTAAAVVCMVYMFIPILNLVEETNPSM